MSRELDQIEEMRSLIGQFDPDRFLAVSAGWLKGNLPGDTAPREGGRSSIMSLPGFDKFDQTLRSARRAYRADLEEILPILRRAIRTQGTILNAAIEVTPDPIVMCVNPVCLNELEPGRKSGKCSRCRLHLHRNGVEWGRAV